MKVKVRIAVAVDHTGDWGSSGWKSLDDGEAMMYASEMIKDGESRYWLEAELDAPESAKVVQATVEPDL